MFKVIEVETGKIYEVYDINCSDRYTYFLIWDKEWCWVDSVFYRPYEIGLS